MMSRLCARAAAMSAFVAAIGLGLPAGSQAQGDPEAPTFSRDIAPILWRHCGECHRPGGAAPFSLLSYREARQRARQIAAATASRYMPPWIPDGETLFEHERRLAANDIDRIGRWVRGGSLEGDPDHLPAMPRWPDGWRLGTPDLVVELPEYTVPASDTTDVFRNFVVEIPTDRLRYVRGLEFLPSSASVHHANIYLDLTGASRALDAADPAPGYTGLIPHSAQFPDGHFLGWTPGQAAPLEPEALAWQLPRGASLLIQLHLRATGKPERIRPRIGLFFGTPTPTARPVMVRLGRQNLDISPGEAHYVATDRVVLPVDVTIHAVQAHSHYRARSMQAAATLPDGSRRTLLSIPRWNFDWQDVYRYAEPVRLPKGTAIALEYVFDNSADNPRNPARPPARTVWGFRSADEMGDLWIQATAGSDGDRQTLEQAAQQKMTAETIVGYETQIGVNPDYIPIRNDVAVLYMEDGRPDAAAPHFARVVQLDPRSPAARFNLGRARQASGDIEAALASYREALAIDPSYERARIGLAESYYLQAAGHDRAGRLTAAIEALRQSLMNRADWPDALSQLSWLLATSAGLGAADREEALRLGLRASQLAANDASVLDTLAAAYAGVGRFEDAVRTAETALAGSAVPDLRAQITSRIALYRQGQPIVRTPQATVDNRPPR